MESKKRKVRTQEQYRRCDNILATYNGVTKPLVEWAREYSLQPATASHRLRRGWSIHDVLTKPLMNKISDIARKNRTEYRTWKAMLRRCYNPKMKRFKDYGGRGIAVCRRWKISFENFLKDMGKKPTPRHSLDRKNNDKNYCPSNCQWSTSDKQTRNRRTNVFIEYNGKRMCIADWAQVTGLSWVVIRGRLEREWPVHDILTQPPTLKNGTSDPWQRGNVQSKWGETV